MSGAQVETSPVETARERDISSWKSEQVSRLTSREKKRYYKYRAVIRAYFTTEASLEEISLRYRLSTALIEKLAQHCLMLHEDGTPWGFRALVPGVEVIDHTPLPSVPETPAPSPIDLEEVEDSSSPDGPVEMESSGEVASESAEDAGGDTSCADGQVIPAAVATDGNDEVDEVDGNGSPNEDVDDTAEREAVRADAIALIDRILVEHDAVNGAQAQAKSIEIVEPPVLEEIDSRPLEVTESPVPDAPSTPATDMVIRSLVVREEMLPAVIARINKRPPATISRQMLLARRSVRRTWLRKEIRAKRRSARKLIGGTVVAAMLFALLVPVVAGLAAYNAYTSIRSVALDGVDHLMAVKALLPVSKSDPAAALNATKLQQARAQLLQAQSDFLQLQQLIAQPGIQATIQQYVPQYAADVGMAQSLVHVGIDVTLMGNELIGVALLGANILHGSPFATGSTKPLITVADVSDIEAAMTHTLYYINDIQGQLSRVSLNALPISATQKKELFSVLTLLPKVQSYVQQGQGLVGTLSWLLGVGHQRRFLVQTMDRAELRPGGGFTGQYGILQIQDGRMAPFKLQDVTELDYAGNGSELGRQAPPQYRSWMNFGNWGLRDSNLSGDFPTTAQLAIQVYQDEGGGPVDGDIAFTPVVIEHILDVVGPIKVPSYNETITAQNIEDKLHYYQQDPNAIALQQQKTGTHNAATRKAFTTLLGQLLLDKVRHESIPTLLKIVQGATKDLQSRDLEIYFTNPQAEAWLVGHGYSGAMSSFSKQDGFMVVQANISISKASQYVQTTYQDAITLDAQGGATHNLTITLNYQQKGPVYGQNTYADYIRVYAPANAVLRGGDGFDTGQPLCNGSQGGSSGGNGGGTQGKPPPWRPGLPPCSQFVNFFPDSSARNCPDGNYNLSGPNSFVPGKGFMPWPVDALGAPTELTSDLPGRAMWGGLTVTPMNCISTITLTWYVPNVVKHTPGQPFYSVLVQKQGGLVPIVQISIDTSQLKGVKPYNFHGNLGADRVFALPVVKKK